MEEMLHRKISDIRRILNSAERLPEYRLLKQGRVIPQLKRAIQKIREGTYGVCDGCGDKISEPRLAAVPGATRCVPCQETLELQL